MGWCSATVIFDSVCDSLLADGDKKPTPEETIRTLAAALEDGDIHRSHNFVVDRIDS